MNELRAKRFLALALALILAVGGVTAWHAAAQGTATVQAGNALTRNMQVDVFFQSTTNRFQLADNLSSGELGPQTTLPDDNGVIFTTGVNAKKSVMLQSGRTYCAIVADDLDPRIEFVDVTSRVSDPAETDRECREVLESLMGSTAQPTPNPGNVVATSTPTLSPIWAKLPTMTPSNNVGPTAVPGDECDGLCRDKAERVYMACVSNGGAADTCRQRSDKYYEDCLAECRIARGDPTATLTEPAPTEPATAEVPSPAPPEEDCTTQCIAEYEAFYADCTAAGGDPQACAQQAKVVYNECLANCQ